MSRLPAVVASLFVAGLALGACTPGKTFREDYSDPRKLESKRPYTQMTEVALVKCTPVRVKRLTESFYSEGGAVVKEGSMPSPGEVQYMTWDRPKVRSDGAKAFSNVCAALAKKAKARR